MLIPFSYVSQAPEKYKTTYLQEDLIHIVSNVQTSEINDPEINSILSTLRDNNQELNDNLHDGDTLIETITKIWAFGENQSSWDIAEEFLSEVFTEEKDNIGLYFENPDGDLEGIFVIDHGVSSTQDIVVSKGFLSGIKKDEPLGGYSARAYIYKTGRTRYIYFGGYIGDGNITQKFTMPADAVVKSLNITASIVINNYESGDLFDIYIDNEKIGDGYSPTTNPFEPIIIYLDENDFGDLFELDETAHDIKFSPRDPDEKNKTLYIGGGYIKLNYTSSEIETRSKQRFLPYVNGLINIYDSIFVPGEITDMAIQIKYNQNTNTTPFIKLGNVQLWNDTREDKTGENTVSLDNDTIFNALKNNGVSYIDISNKTVPLRVGVEEIQQSSTLGIADVILITDLSGSMRWELNSSSTGDNRSCSDAMLSDNTTMRIALARCLALNFTDLILETPGNRLGLVGFSEDIISSHELSNDSESLKDQIWSYWHNGGTCICCGINKAYEMFNESETGRQRYVIVMSDGIAGMRCNSTRYCSPYNSNCQNGWWWGVNRCYAGTSTSGTTCCSGSQNDDNCKEDSCHAAINNTVWSGNRTFVEKNLTKGYTIGFVLGDCPNALSSMTDTANAMNGTFYLGNNATELQEIYEGLARNISSVAFVNQTVNVTGDVSSNIIDSSFININYSSSSGFDEESSDFGDYITFETDGFNDGQTTIESIVRAPAVIPYEATIVSYSGDLWTKFADIDSTTVYSLNDWGLNYIGLGDPFNVNIPRTYIDPNQDSIVNLKLGRNSEEEQNPTDSSKIIYTVIVPPTFSYSEPKPTAEGCIWNIETEDGNIATLSIPTNYEGTDNCTYNSTNFTSPECIGGQDNDAYRIAVYNLLSGQLDLNADGRVEMGLGADVSINAVILPGIPFMKYTVIKAKTWR